jgi:hypothetical protein
MKTWLAAVGVVVLLVSGCAPKLEEGEILEKEGDTFTIRLSRRVEAPIDKVWQSLGRPENLEKYADQYKQTKLVKEEGNKKVLDYRVQALGQLQAFTMELTFEPEQRVVRLKTLESSLADVQGEYALAPGPDANSTIVTYRATQKDKVNIPAPVSVQKTAIKDLFDNLVSGITKSIEAGEGAG